MYKKHRLHTICSFIGTSPTMEFITTDIAIEVGLSVGGCNYASDYVIYDTTKGLHQMLKQIFTEIQPSVLNTHNHIRVFLQKEQQNLRPDLPYITVSENFLGKIRDLNHTRYGVRFCVALQKTNGDNSFFLLPQEVENYLMQGLMKDNFIAQESCSDIDVTIMVNPKDPKDEGLDEVDSIYSVDITDA